MYGLAYYYSTASKPTFSAPSVSSDQHSQANQVTVPEVSHNAGVQVEEGPPVEDGPSAEDES